MYADGDLVYEAFNASLPEPDAGPLSVGLGGHLAPSAGAVSEDAWGGCFSPNYLERLSGPRERLFGRANDQKSSGEMRAIYGPKGRKYDPTGRNLTCETPNRWDELDGGDVMWCPADWRGDPPPLPPSRRVSPRENRCDAKVRAPAAPMYSYSATEPWQRNALLSNEHQSDEVNLAHLGSYDDPTSDPRTCACGSPRPSTQPTEALAGRQRRPDPARGPDPALRARPHPISQ